MKQGFWIVVKDLIRKADVILEILDARMPDLTRNKRLEQYAAASGKRLMLVINKKDLISENAIRSIEKSYSGRDYALVCSRSHKSISRFIGQIKSKAKKDKLKVAVIGYPNTGKSSLINITLVIFLNTSGPSSSTTLSKIPPGGEHFLASGLSR